MGPSYKLPGPEWFFEKYGVRWDGQYQDLTGHLAQVVKIETKDRGESYVVRISNPKRISHDRLSMVHRFQAHLSTKGVRTVLPLKTLSGEAYLTTEQGMTIEVFPFVHGRPPRRCNASDIRRVGSEIGRLHSAGTGYMGLGGEESLYQNHLAINRLLEEVLEKRESTRGKSFHKQYNEYVAETERWVEVIEDLRPGLAETGLHMDTGPQNMIIDGEGQLWFIDCAHMVRGRRVFEVCVSMYYLDQSSDVPLGEPRRYQPVDEKMEASFLKGYWETCDPPWSRLELKALRIERMLMFIHGVTYWTTKWHEEIVLYELARWNEYYSNLKEGLQNHA